MSEAVKAEVKHNRKPRIGDMVLFVLGDWSANRGQERAAVVIFVHDLSARSAADHAENPGLVNLSVFHGRENDFPAQVSKEDAGRAVWPIKGIKYDPSGELGTWHFKE